MGFRWVLRWQHPGPLPGRQVFETICAALETYKTSNKRRWAAQNAILRVVQVETALGLREAGGPSVDLQLLTFHDAPELTYLLVRKAGKVMEADKSILEVLTKVAPYKVRATLHFEGWAYNLGDFNVRVGKVTLRPTEEFKGFMVEVEYAPVSTAEQATPALKEFVEFLQTATAGPGGRLQVVAAPLDDFSLSAAFSLQHLAVQYSTLTAALL